MVRKQTQKDRTIRTSKWAGRSSVLWILLLCASLGMAQLDTGTISGTVTDQSGAAAPGATITMKNVGTGVSRKVETNAAGRYEAAALPVGNYEVEASLAGFQTVIRSGITLGVGQNALVNMVMQVGEVTQSVTISGEASQVETTTATVSQLVDERKVLDIPLNNRDLTQLVYFDALVLRPQTAARGQRNASGGMGDHLSVAGSRAYMSAYLLDGVNNSDFSNNAQSATSGYSGAETVKEFQVITNNYSAEYRSVAGAIVSAVTKSGTNAFHGTLFEFLRNDDLDAFQWESKARGGANPQKPEFRRNQFGFSVGGPIIKDKTFFFGSYEGQREATGQNDVLTVPTARGRLGFLGSNLYDPIRARINPNETFNLADFQAGRTPIRVDPRVVPYLNLYPLPGEGGTALVRELLDPLTGVPDGRAEVSGLTNLITNGDFGAIKLDHQFASQRKGFLGFTYNVDNSARSTHGMFPGLANSVGESSEKKVISVRHTSILSPTALNELVFGFTRANPAGSIPIDEPDWKNLNGLDLRFGTNRQRMGQLSGVDSLPSLGYPRDRGLYARDYWTYKDNLSLSRTNHTIKIGAEINPQSYVLDQVGGSFNGVYVFSTLHRLLAGDTQRLEQDLAKGTVLPNGQVVQAIPIFYFHQTQLGFYLQDNWKVRPSLTLNLGLRYEFMSTATEDNGNFANLRHFTDPVTETGLYFKNPTKLDFSPRFGFAWSPGNHKSAVRGGLGIFYAMPDMVYYRLVTQEMVPFAAAGFLNKEDTAIPSQGFLGFVDFPHGPDTLSRELAQVPAFRTMEYDHKSAYVYRWSLTLEREMAGWFGSLAYNGSRGVHLLTQSDGNQAKWIGYPANPTPGQGELQWQQRPVNDPVPQELAINPVFSNIWVNAPRASSFYHGLTVSVRRRMAAGLQFQAAYNFSKNIDSGAGSSNAEENLPQNQRIDLYWQYGRLKGASLISVKQNFVSNFTYDFPKTGLTGVAGALVNGWQMNGILSLSSGTPFNLQDSNTRQTDAMRRTGQIRPNLAANGNNNPVSGNPDAWFDVNQFVPSVCRTGVYCVGNLRTNPDGTPNSNFNPNLPAGATTPRTDLGYQIGFWGNLGAGTLIGPGLAQFDTSLTKSIPVTENKRFQFRAEFFNLANHPNFRIPVSTLYSSNGTRSAQAGRVNTTRTSGRQIQFGLKFIF